MTVGLKRGPTDTTAMDPEVPAEGWVVWSDAEERSVLTYRPDVFDSDRYPAPCLPTIYLARGSRHRRPGVDLEPPPDAGWTVTLYLEPEIDVETVQVEERRAALDAVRDVSARFAAGEVDYRAGYQVTDGREAYLAKLDALTGRDA